MTASDARPWWHVVHRNPAKLVKPVPDVVERALDVIPHDELYALLQLWSLDRREPHNDWIKGAGAYARRLDGEAKKWRAAAKALRAASAALSRAPRRLVAHEFDLDGITAIDSIAAWADNERQAAETMLHGLRDWSGRYTAADRAKHTHKSHYKPIVRERATMLVEKLEKNGWSRPDVADLVIASERAWSPPPIQLPPSLRNRETMKERLRDLVAPRNSRRTREKTKRR